MRHEGRITEWDDDRGFGFATAKGVRGRAFVHINAFDCAVTRPRAGSLISYELLTDCNGRFNASGIRFVEPRFHDRPVGPVSPRHRRSVGRLSPRKALSVLFFAAIAVGVFAASVPLVVALGYAFMSVVAVQLYGIDKSAALNNQWRIPEATLHFIGLAGGWPGALFAQAAFQHKTRKPTFQFVFWLTALLNCAGLAWLIAQGSDLGLPLDFDLPIRLAPPMDLNMPTEPGLPTITPLQQ